ncbi:MAG TPA: hypothetical protein VGV92_00465 [Gammaproteobacteria bacterium]|nr:hypothetical protein [Gammaproteobacteria bacterium]
MKEEPKRADEIINAQALQHLLDRLSLGDLQRAASTCRFFRDNAREVVFRRLNKHNMFYNISSVDPFTVPVHVLKLCEALNIPIDQYAKKERYYDSPLTLHRGFAIRVDGGTVAICQRKNKQDLCIVGTFVLDSANSKRCNHVYQFIAGVDENGCVYLDRLTNEKVAEVVEYVLWYRAVGTTVFGEYTHNMLKLLSKLLDRVTSREPVTFETLFSDYATTCKLHPNLRIPTEKAIRLAESSSPRMGCCAIS